MRSALVAQVLHARPARRLALAQELMKMPSVLDKIDLINWPLYELGPVESQPKLSELPKLQPASSAPQV